MSLVNLTNFTKYEEFAPQFISLLLYMAILMPIMMMFTIMPMVMIMPMINMGKILTTAFAE